MVTLSSGGGFVGDRGQSSTVTWDGVELPNLDSLIDFPVGKAPGKTGPTLTRQSVTDNPTVSTVWAEPWQQMRHGQLFAWLVLPQLSVPQLSSLESLGSSLGAGISVYGRKLLH